VIQGGTTFSQIAPAPTPWLDGGFAAVWTIGSRSAAPSETGIVSTHARLFDSNAVALGPEFVVDGHPHGNAELPSLDSADDGRFVVAWQSVPNRDGHGSGIFAQRFAPRLCGPAPEPDASCRLSTASGAGRGRLDLKNYVLDRRDMLRWEWNSGVSTDLSDFGNPATGTARYRLCVYDGSVAVQPLVELDIATGTVQADCGKRLCWVGMGNGWGYRNAPGTTAVRSAKLIAGGDDAARIKVQARGARLNLPALASLVPNVVVQLLIDDGTNRECFKTSFPGSSAAGSIRKQTENVFQAVGP
jgi:hypothetical protein